MRQWSLAAVGAFASIAVLAVQPAARADFAINLTNCNDSFNCTPETGIAFGTVSVKDIAANEVEITVSLNSHYNFANTGNIGIAFSLASGIGAATLSGYPTSGSFVWAPDSGK